MSDGATFRRQSLGLLSMLTVQFILGMILNLFVQLPKVHPGITGNYFSRAVHSFGWAITTGGGIVLLLHVLVAIALLLASLGLLAEAIAVKSRPWLSASIVGAIGVIAALTNGLAFLGYNSDVSSFVMAMGFIVAATAYSTALAYAPKSSLAAASFTDAKQHKHSPRFTGKFKPSHG